MCADDRKDRPDADSPVDVDTVLSLNFVPQWARRPPDAIRIKRFDDHPDGHGRKQDRGGAGRTGHRPAQRASKRRARPGEARPERGGSPRPGSGAGRQSDQSRMPRRSPAAPGSNARQEQRPPQEDRRQETLLQVQFLPESSAVSELVKRIKGSKKAYPLLDLASLLLAKEGLCCVRIEVTPEARGSQRLYQCRLCHTLTLDAASLERHLLEDHLASFFSVATETVDPPSGVFVCVARCGISGTLLGPPNHHSYTEAVKALHAARYASMDIAEYRRRITISHAPEDVEAWKQACSQRTVYRLLSEGEAGEALTLPEAQRYMREHVMPAKSKAVHRVVLGEADAHRIRDPRIRRAIRDEWQKESRFPIHLALALRAALRSRKLHLFRAGPGKGIHFVMPMRPVAIDPDTTIPEIRAMLLYLKEHPGCTAHDIITDLLPEADRDDEQVKALLQPLHWLADKGHVIAFFNGTLAVPLYQGK